MPAFAPITVILSSGCFRPDHDMSQQQQKKHRFLSAISSPFRALRRRPPLPNNGPQVVNGISNNTTRGSLANSRILPRIEDSQTETNRRRTRNELTKYGSSIDLRCLLTCNRLFCRPIAMFSDIEELHIGVGNFTQNINNRK